MLHSSALAGSEILLFAIPHQASLAETAALWMCRELLDKHLNGDSERNLDLIYLLIIYSEIKELRYIRQYFANTA